MERDQITLSTNWKRQFIEETLTPYELLLSQRWVSLNYINRSYLKLVETKKIFKILWQTTISKKEMEIQQW